MCITVYKHSFETDHQFDFQNLKLLGSDNNETGLKMNESLQIKVFIILVFIHTLKMIR